MNRRLEWSPRSRADLRAIQPHDRRQADRITLAIQTFAEHGRGDIRKLLGSVNEYRLRVGDWRVIFRVEDAGRDIVVSRVLNRRDAYRN